MKKKSIIIFSIIAILCLSLILELRQQFAGKRLNYTKMDTVCFEKDILPVLIKNCGVAGCHDQQTRSGGYKFADYTSIIKGIKPFKPEESILLKSIIGKGASPMPPGQPLPINEKRKITIWIGQGAEYTRCPSPPKK